jgi:hypothetical protein
MDANERADVELVAWMRFIAGLGLGERQSKRLLSAWLRLHRTYFRD